MQFSWLNQMELVKSILVDNVYTTDFPSHLVGEVDKIRKRKTYKWWTEFLIGKGEKTSPLMEPTPYTPYQCMRIHRMMDRMCMYGDADRSIKSYESLVTAISDYKNKEGAFREEKEEVWDESHK